MGRRGGHARIRAVVPIVAVMAVLMLAVPSAQAVTTFVQDQRVNSLTLQFTTDAFASNNAFGSAFAGSTAQTGITNALATGIGDGSISWMFEMQDLTDLTGTTDPSFHLGVFNPTRAAGAGYDGSSDLDWWYQPDATELNPDGSAKQQLTASFVAKTLSAGPGSVDLNISLLGTPMTLAMSHTQIQAVAGASSAPTSSNGSPPGHLAGEYLDPTLTSFQSMSQGKLSGDISALSLYNTSVPSGFIGASCNANYTTANTLLDVLVTGCTAFFIQEVKATQPDTVTSVGSGTYRFAVNSSHQVTSCTRDGVAATLADCLAGAAYSSYFQFTTDRVIDQLRMPSGKLLTVDPVGSGSGTVIESPVAYITCGTDCTEPYDAGTQVTLDAYPSPGSRFAGWTGCDSPSGTTCELTMDADKSVTASFVVLRTLTVTKTGSGSVSSSPSGIDCGATCAAEYDGGAAVSLTATPAAGSAFAGWSGGGCSGTGTCLVTLDADKSVAATFVALRELTVNKAGPGTVSSSPAGIDCGAACSASYDNGSSVTLTATAASGFHFAGWSGDCDGTGTCTLTMSADRATVATFEANPRAVECHVPKIEGKPLAAAERAITRAHCAVGRIKKAYSATVKSGRVISQKPRPGTVSPSGSKISLKISKGKKR